MSDGRRWVAWLALPVVVFLGVLLVTSATDDAKSSLEVLREDPLAHVRLPDAVDTRVNERELQRGSFTGFSSPAMVRTTFVLPSGSSLERAVDVLVGKASQHGWELEQGDADAANYSAFKKVEGRLVQLIIATSRVEPRVSVELSTRD